MLTRRDLLIVGSASGAQGLVRAAPTVSPDGLRLVYGCSAPPRLPPQLELESPSMLEVEFGGPPQGAVCSLGLRVRLDGERCLLPLALWTARLADYWRYREALCLPTYLGDVAWEQDRWTLTIEGRPAFTARPADQSQTVVEGQAARDWISFNVALEPNWSQGPVSVPAELWRIPSADRPFLRALEARKIESSGTLGSWLSKLGASGPVVASTVSRSALGAAVVAGPIDVGSFQPFALRNYPATSLGLEQADTAYLGPAELHSFRERREIRLSDIMLVSIDAIVAQASVERLLPPPCISPETGVVRVMSVRGLDDPGLDEAWLFLQCGLEGQLAWYAAAHVRASILGSEFGREVLGYPTVPGSVSATLGASLFSSSVARGDSSLYNAGGLYGGFSTGTTLAEMPVAALRLRRGTGGTGPSGEVLLQPWYFQGLSKPVRTGSVNVSFPAARKGMRPSPWNRMGPASASRARVFDGATLQRLRPRVVGRVANVGAFYEDRCDGHLPWKSAGNGPSD